MHATTRAPEFSEPGHIFARRGRISGLFASCLGVATVCIALTGCETDILPELLVPGELPTEIGSVVDCAAFISSDVNLNGSGEADWVTKCGVEGSVNITSNGQATALDRLRNVVVIKGDLTIGWNGDFNMLQNLQRVDGSLTFTGQVAGVSGLANLTSVGKDVILASNKLNTTALSKLKHINGHLRLQGAVKPTLSALSVIGGNLHTGYSAKPLAGLAALEQVGGAIYLEQGQVSDVSGLTTLGSVGGGLYGTGGSSLKTMAPFQSIKVWGATAKGGRPDIRLKNMMGLQDFRGLEGFKKVGFFRVEGGAPVTSTLGLGSIADATYVQFLTSLVPNTDGLTGLVKCTGTTLQSNGKLTSVSYPKMAECGAVSIANNNVLSSVSFPAFTTAQSVTILSNPKLQTISMPKLTSADNFFMRKLPELKTLDVAALKGVKNLEICETGLPKATVDAIYQKAGQTPPSSTTCK